MSASACGDHAPTGTSGLGLSIPDRVLWVTCYGTGSFSSMRARAVVRYAACPLTHRFRLCVWLRRATSCSFVGTAIARPSARRAAGRGW